MYLKLVKSKNYTYLKICESYRDKGKVRQRVVANLGRLDILQKHGLENIVNDLAKFISSEKLKNYKDISKMEEMARYNYGFIAYAKLWNSLGLSRILKEISEGSKIEFDFIKVVFSMVVGRLLNPSSKLYYYNHKDRYLFLNEDLELQHIYRSLDILAENKEEIEFKMFENVRDLFNLKLDVVFYDVTTFYFESKREDELRGFGFSKDNKVNEVQVVMGLLIDREGRPIGYELFRGNTVDSKTMIKVIKKLREKFSIGRIIFVADKGLNSKVNLKELKDNGFDYVVSGRLRQMPRELLDRILGREGFIKAYGYEYKELEHTNFVKYEDGNEKKVFPIKEKLVVTYSEERANYDRLERERLLMKAKDVILYNDKRIVENKKGYRRYIDKEYVEGGGEYILKLDEEKIKEEERFDGYYLIETSDTNLSGLEVAEIYHNLWKVEESFRIMKSTMKVRPIFHWTPKRIEGHFLVCFIAFLLERELEARLKRNKKSSDEEISPERIKEALNSMEVSEIEVEGEKVFLRSKQKSLGGKIFGVLKITNLKNVSSLEDIKEWYSNFVT